MKIEQVSYVMMLRLTTTIIIGSVFLPPDYQNPHAVADVIMLALGGLLWGVTDILLHDAKEQP